MYFNDVEQLVNSNRWGEVTWGMTELEFWWQCDKYQLEMAGVSRLPFSRFHEWLLGKALQEAFILE